MSNKIQKNIILKILKKFIKLEGRRPKKKDFSNKIYKKKYNLPAATTIRTKFGGLNKLFKTLKINERLYIKKYTKSQALKDLKNFIKKNKRYPRAKECDLSKDLPGHQPLIRLFGSHKKAIRAAGFKGFIYETDFYFDEDFFKKVNTEAKAYFLGLMFSDGWVLMKTPLVGIGLNIKDLHILKTFKKFTKAEKRIYFNDKTSKNKNINPGIQATLSFRSEKMKKNLIALGIIPRKSLKIKFPNNKQLPKKYMKDFVRGYFDGDGSISKSMRVDFTSGSKIFLLSLKKILEKYLNVSNLKVENRTNKTNFSSSNRAKRLYIQKKEYIKKLFLFMYKNSHPELRLKRKYLAFKNVLR